MTAAPVGRYGVVGNPVAHSLSPLIHAAFGEQTGRSIDYRRVLAPLDAFAATIADFAAGGGRGLNVTVPFKLDAYLACARMSARARRAGAVNWLVRDGDDWIGDNTDGAGLVRDLERLVRGSDRRLDGRLLLIGAGGAARGVLAPLLACGPARCVVVNRDLARAETMVDDHAANGSIAAANFASLGAESFDLVVNATSASLTDDPLPLPPTVFAEGALAYDLMYAAGPTRFMRDAAEAGALVSDGLGMLVEQAAESFHLWLDERPDTAAVLAALRARLAAA